MALLAAALLVVSLPAAAKTAGCADSKDLESLKACQERERDQFIERAKKKTGKPPSEEALDAFEEKQRQAAKPFFERTTFGKSDLQLGSTLVDAPDDASAEPRDEEGKAIKRRPAKKAELDELKRSLEAKSDGGKNGVTPEMADDVRAYLKKNQGSISPEMEHLLQSTSKDGPNLTKETMHEVRGAARQAKERGLDLGLSPEQEKQVLEEPLDK